MLDSKKVDYSFGNYEFHTESNVVELPNLCPRCNTVIRPDYSSSYLVDEDLLQITYFCNSCRKVFLTDYSVNFVKDDYLARYNIISSKLIKSYPITHENKVFSDDIKDVSENFITIYNQSYEAETSELNMICGMGYRKALEFLVHDYLNIVYKDDEEKLNEINNSKTTLNKKINLLKDDDLESLCRASAWIGNDETHPIRKHDNENVNSLKSFIHSVVKHIDYKYSIIKANELIKK